MLRESSSLQCPLSYDRVVLDEKLLLHEDESKHFSDAPLLIFCAFNILKLVLGLIYKSNLIPILIVSFGS